MYLVSINLDWNYKVYVGKDLPKAEANGCCSLVLEFTNKKSADQCAKHCEGLTGVASVDVAKVAKATKEQKERAFSEFRPRSLDARIAGIVNPEPFIRPIYPKAQ